MDWIAWHGRALTDHVNLTNQYTAQGYGFISLSIYGSIASPYYAAVMIQPAPSQQHHYASVPGNQMQQTFNSEAAQGYGPAIIAASGATSNPMFAAVFEPQNPIALTRWGLPWVVTRDSLQQLNNGGMTAAAQRRLVTCLSASTTISSISSISDAGGSILDDLRRGRVALAAEQQRSHCGPSGGCGHLCQRSTAISSILSIACKGSIQDAWFGGVRVALCSN